MKEVKQPSKKPLIYYYAIMLLVVFVLNALVFPNFNQRAITETERRREIQQHYNEEHGIVPKTIIKGIRDVIEISSKKDIPKTGKQYTKRERLEMIDKMTKQMREAARQLNFEQAAYLRDKIAELRKE